MIFIYLIFIFLPPSVLFGAYTVIVYKFLRRITKNCMLPLILTLLLPAMYIPLTVKIPKELLPIVGYIIIMVVFVTPASTAAIIPIPLIDKLTKKEILVFIASTLAILYVLISGFAEVMGAESPGYSVTKVTIVKDIYITCFKIFAISLIVYLIAFITRLGLVKYVRG